MEDGMSVRTGSKLPSDAGSVKSGKMGSKAASKAPSGGKSNAT